MKSFLGIFNFRTILGSPENWFADFSPHCQIASHIQVCMVVEVYANTFFEIRCKEQFSFGIDETWQVGLVL